MKNAGRYVFKCAYDTHLEMTRIFDFVQPTIIALWNLRWQVQGFLSQVPTASSDDLANRFALGSEMRGGELKRACVETPWDRQKADFAEFVLITEIAAFEDYTARLAEALVPQSSVRALSKSLQFPKGGSSSALARVSQPSPALKGVFQASCKNNSRYSKRQLNNLLICYRFFKSMRNNLSHNGGIADQVAVDDYLRFKAIATVADLGLPEVPIHHPIVLGQKIKLELRGVIGLSDVILRILTTYDAELSECTAAEKQVITRVIPVKKKDQLIKAGQKNRKIVSIIHQSGLPSPSLSPQFTSFLQAHLIVPAFW